MLADRLEHQGEEVFGAVDDVGVGEFLVEDGDVGQADALEGEVAVRVELDADDAGGAYDVAHALDDVAFDVVIAVGDHGAVQAQEHAVEREGLAELAENFVAHGFVVGAIGGAGGRGGGNE